MEKNNSNFNSFVSIIILNFNGGNYLFECISSIKKNTDEKYEIILIDNNSSDGSQKKCKKYFPEIILLQNNQNLGMHARNTGIKEAQGNFLVFLDSDTTVTKNWLSNLIQSYNHNGDGLYQPKIMDMNNSNTISSCGNFINIFGFGFAKGRGELDIGQYDSFSKINFPAGACTFSSAKIINKIGWIDPIFFAYYDDVDFGWRSALLDIPIYFEPTSVVHHHVSLTLKWNKQKIFLAERNRLICILSNYKNLSLIKIFPSLIIIEIGVLFFLLKKKMFWIKIKSYFSIIKLQKDIFRKKKFISNNRCVSDNQIIQSFSDNFVPPFPNDDSITFSQKIISKLSIIVKKYF